MALASSARVRGRSAAGLSIGARNRRFILLCLAPASLALLGIIAYPLAYGLFLSLTDANPLSLARDYIGFENFRNILDDSVYQNSLGLTLRYTVAIVLIEFPLAMAVALMLNEPIRGRAIYRALLLVPWVMPNVVAAIIWRWIYSPDFGLLNYVLAQLHLIDSYLSYTGDPTRALPAVIAVSVWKGLPFTAVVLLAGLQAVPSDYYEAARVDGANAWQRFRDITVPGIFPIIVIVLVLRFVWSFNSFDLVYVLTGGGPGWATQLLSIYVYLSSFQYQQLGYGAAMAVTMLIMLAIPVSLFVYRALPRES